MATEYRPIPSAPGYLAGDDGSIIGKWGYALSQCRTPNGYLAFRMSRPGFTPVTFSSHVAACEAFHGVRPDGMEVAHENGEQEDNRAANLAWKTRSQNMLDKTRHGTQLRGERHYRAKLTDAQVAEIRANTTDSHAELARRYGVSNPHICNIRAGKVRKLVTPPA